jgi:hypothetical protein
MHTYVLETLIPLMTVSIESGIRREIEHDEELLLQRRSASNMEELSHDTSKDFLQSYGLLKVSMATVLRWMHSVGFGYKNRSRHYFVDGHEKPETLAYQPVFTKQFIAHKVKAYRWIQLSVLASRPLEAQDFAAKNCGYRCVNITLTRFPVIRWAVL